jgi:hypothetical protein
MAKADNADVHATENRDFYPEDAQERNFAEARRVAVVNTEKDKAASEEDNRRQAEREAAEQEDARQATIPAQPETTADTNPEQVKTVDQTSKSSKKK